MLESLNIDNETVNSIENQTKEQAGCPEWYKERKNGFAASICNKLNSVKTNSIFYISRQHFVWDIY